ncbi:sulfate/molybdate ABC transporter ATP-binding protein [Dyadobacter fanqingshengii]|uniref:ATP-binding cassette domain-containing protein n=1 Tax=Dyadobacter fanqingshengii TaxID=2906443 RepID=A0A9X1TIK9_9BACT|nr:ATP-binding cassette domain-containing protein [Dyadobacter fanqingshengii]MCF0042967.1 ATP-binding cassette domain-containing protein [Dyadobacter fanqingshengii]USJ35522.1 ATP-binding cassette domain-containing protein [Dyadobacter fanqingshengii]
MSDSLLDVHIKHSLQTVHGVMPMEIALSLAKEQILAITGPSGAGKTTLLRHIAGLLTPETGKIVFGNELWLDSSKQKSVVPQLRNIGFVFQDYALFPHLTVEENLLFGLPKGSDRSIVEDLLTATELSNLANRKPNQLSGGQQQRVALARALVRKPDLMLLDEPFAALDYDMRYHLQDMLLKFHQQHHFTMIIVTHDIGEIFRLADQVAIIENGKIIRQGTPTEVYAKDQSQTGDFVIFGEVLSCVIQADQLLVSALVENKVRQLTLPLDLASEMIPGNTFTLHYPMDSARVMLIRH